ncbi:MAG: NAD(P)-binding domain-containing protein [Chloroflexi bacterium]|nr:NAD(P)-binding domain-containing protein [Ktedonobacteraceae bacterium]MBV9705884.1 NAD(P)-binding domain-containing protein [Chloroflexota bacterium]
MQFGVFGTGMVGQALASKLVSLGDRVMIGARNRGNEKAVTWTKAMGSLASQGSFADAARFGEMVLNATSGTVSLEVLNSAGAENLNGKILIDVSNPLDFSAGMPPTLTICNTESLGEQIQSAFPHIRVVKALNTMNAEVMVNPSLVPGAHNVFICGNDAQAKTQVAALLERFGWPSASILDLGDISSARGTEMYVPLWLRLWGVVGTGHFNIRVVSA